MNAWGISWGNAWANSWGTPSPPPVIAFQPTSGAALLGTGEEDATFSGGEDASRKKRRREEEEVMAIIHSFMRLH